MKKRVLSYVSLVMAMFLLLSGCTSVGLGRKSVDVGNDSEGVLERITIENVTEQDDIEPGEFVYYDTLTEVQKEMYNAISQNVKALNDNFVLYRYEGYEEQYGEDAQIAQMTYQMDNPLDNQIVQNFLISYNDQELTVSYQDTLYTLEEAVQRQEVVRNTVNEFVVTLDGLSDEEKYTKIHDWITEGTKYDNAMSNSSHNIYAAIVEKYAVCDALAYAYKYVCDVANVPCSVVIGYTKIDTGTNGHAWNVVPLDGTWKLVDITYDVYLGGNSHEYLLCDSVYLNDRHPYSGYTSPGYTG